MIAHAGLVFIVYLELGRRRYIAAKAKEIKYDDFKIVRTDSDAEFSAKAARNIINNFELPVLFYAVILALFLTESVTTSQLVLAWLFTISRYGHSFVHLTHNHVFHRSAWFFLCFFCLLAMWLLFALGLSIGA